MYFCQQENKNNENEVSIVNVCERQRDRETDAERVGGRKRETEGRRKRETDWFCSCRSMVITCYQIWVF